MMGMGRMASWRGEKRRERKGVVKERRERERRGNGKEGRGEGAVSQIAENLAHYITRLL